MNCWPWPCGRLWSQEQDRRPASAADACPTSRKSLVQFFTPSYSLYPVLADIHGAAPTPVPLSADFDDSLARPA